MHRPRSNSPLHIDIYNSYPIRIEKLNAGALYLFPATCSIFSSDGRSFAVKITFDMQCWDIKTALAKFVKLFWGRITLNLKFPISRNSVLKDRQFVSKNSSKSSKKNRGAAPAYPLLAGLRTSLPPRWVLNVWPQWCWITRTVHFALSTL